MQKSVRVLQSSIDSVEKVFGSNFQVVELSNPLQYLPQYQQNQLKVQKSANEACLTGCGSCCMCIVAPFGCISSARCCCCVYEMGTAKIGLVETFGRFNRILNPGLSLINPCAEEVFEVDLRIVVLSVGHSMCLTKDSIEIKIQSSISYRVINPISMHYNVGRNLNRALIELTISGLRHCVGERTLTENLHQRLEIAQNAKEFVTKGLPSGLKIQNVFIDQIILPEKLRVDLTAAARQKRLSEATIINSKADVEAASLLKERASLLDSKAAMQIRYLQMVQKLGQNGVLVMMDIGIDKQGFKT